ncbi:MAG TPA: hypothetical protein VNO26_14750 [Candidatus Limnocylindria bacterium]|nr:hypothetical protein [Candidatus Limnocylindria bacterium]
MTAVVSLLAILLAAVPTRALVPGGGVADKDCRLAFEGVAATAGASGVVCVDGDAACDADGAVNGFCRFALQVCAGVSLEGCAPVEMDRIEVGGEPLPAPEVPAGGGACGEPATIDVPAGAPAVAVTLRGYRNGKLGEVDYLNLCCRSEAGALAAAACSVAMHPAASGCADLPRRALGLLERARTLVAKAEAQPTAARKLLRKARKKMRRLRALGRRVARRNDCGFALGLMATHAVDTLDAARSAVP